MLRDVLDDSGVPRSCEDCFHQRCDERTTITDRGDVVYGVADMPGVVTWPGCPMLWACLRQVGADARPLNDCLAWLVERGAHRGDVGAGAAGLYREYLLRRELGSTLMETRRYYQAKAGVK